MAGIAVTAAITTNALTGGTGTGTGTQSGAVNPSHLNDLRISAVIDRLSSHLYNNTGKDVEFENLCHSLSRGIDFSVANHEVPKRSQELPSLIKKVCQIKNDGVLQAAVMVLMISVKSACQNGWFPNQDSEELINLAKMIASNFCSGSNFNAQLHPSHAVISTVVSRFYPRLKMSHIFVYLEAKPGFDAYISDFQISKHLKCSPGDRIRLLVAQTDSLETSSCLVTPAKVNFLLNGKGVERRTSIFVDTGPQVPTIVTPLLKYGSNLLQAVGEFNGNYIIAVAFMSEVPNPDRSTLQNYEEHAPATVDADSEVIEGSSRISVNCPISFKRIKTPVKGVSCKHIQCFDFDNYVDINSRRPSWRCPHCNQHVCFSDIRIDQKMVKVLKEVGPNVSDIIFSSDGSWNAVMESEDTTEKSETKTLTTGREESPQPANILDLTQTDDPMDVNDASDIQEIKHFSKANALQNNSSIENDFWTGVYMSTFGTGSLNTRPNAQASGPSVSTSLLTELSSSTNREVGAFHHNVAAASAPQTPHYQLGNRPVVSDYGRPSLVPSHITRTASAVQALPAQSPASFLQRSSANGASQASPAAPNLITNRASQHQAPPMSSSPLLQHPSLQKSNSFPSARTPQQNAGFRDPNQVPNMYRVSNEHQSSSQPVNYRIPRPTSQSPVHRTGVAASGQQSNLIAEANRAAHMSVSATRSAPSYPWNPLPVGHNTPTPVGDQRATPSSQPFTRTEAQGSADMSWRPAGRMRGALSGQAYNEAYNRYITQPSQQAQAARPASNNGLPDLPPSIASGTVLGTPPPSADPVVRPAGSVILPNASSGGTR